MSSGPVVNSIQRNYELSFATILELPELIYVSQTHFCQFQQIRWKFMMSFKRSHASITAMGIAASLFLPAASYAQHDPAPLVTQESGSRANLHKITAESG